MVTVGIVFPLPVPLLATSLVVGKGYNPAKEAPAGSELVAAAAAADIPDIIMLWRVRKNFVKTSQNYKMTT